MLAILTLAVLIPDAEGSKVMTNVEMPLVAATGETGCVVTVKSAAFVPLSTAFGVPESVNAASPVFSIEKVLTTVPVGTF